MYRGDILVLYKKEVVEVGDVVVYKISQDPIPIVHRITGVQEVPDKEDPSKLQRIFLTKGDNNEVDDRGLYPRGVKYVEEQHIQANVMANIPYSGFITLMMNDYPMVKYALMGTMFLSVILSKDSNNQY